MFLGKTIQTCSMCKHKVFKNGPYQKQVRIRSRCGVQKEGMVLMLHIVMVEKAVMHMEIKPSPWVIYYI